MSLKDIPIELLIGYGMQIAGALIVLAVGAIIANWVGNLARGWLEKREMEPPVRLLLVRIVKGLIFIFALLVALDQFGVKIAPLVAGLGVAGIGVGIALQGVLGNVMAGLTIIFTKPYRVGEYIELLDVYGQVKAIDIFSTVLEHADHSRVVIPNRKVIGEILHNYGTMRQLNLSVGIAYASDLGRTMEIIRGVLDKNPRVLKEPSALVGVTMLDDSAITVSVKPWVEIPDFIDAQAELYREIVEQFRTHDISIPFPQREVRLLGRQMAEAA
ncbi:MAG: mechanosensitive ion channel family protein [Nitrospirota bacterium]|nr:mechanosensitive ion channel family protein [Nitrospirota bacterium]